MVREAVKEDLFEILNLYLFLHEDNVPEDSEHLQKTWKDILEDVNNHMLLTGTKNESTLDFYRKAGYNSEDKTAFIQWLD